MIINVIRTGVVVFVLSLCVYVPQKIQAQIAPGVIQSAARTANITGTVIQSDGVPVANADVKLTGPALLSTKSDAHGTFDFASVPWGTYAITAISQQGTVLRTNVLVNADINIAIQYEAQNGPKEIAHVSTTAQGAHINVTSSSIASINPSDYAFQGNATWKELFAQVPGVAVSGCSLGGFSALETIPGAPQAPVVLSINGALPYETSTLLDGMPLQGTSAGENYGAVGGGLDLSNFPMNAFDSADIVRGPGANAPSIVDSVGGSFVLHAPGQVTANHFEFSASNDPYGGIISNAKVAVHLGRLSATVVYGINNSPGPLGNGMVISALSFAPATIGGEAVHGSTFAEQANGEGILNCYCAFTDTLLYCCVSQPTNWSSHSGAIDLTYNVTPSITAEVFYVGATSQQYQQAPYVPVQFAPSASIPAYGGSFAPSPSGQNTYAFLSGDAPLLSAQASSLLEEKLTAYVGRGVLRFAAVQNNTFASEKFAVYPPSGQYTLWGTANVGPSPGTPTAYDGVSEALTFSNIALDENYWSNNRDLLGSYALQVGSASSVGISYVTSYYNEPYSEEEFSSGVPIFSEGQGSAVSETTNEMRMHVDTQVSDKFSLGLSWYFARGSYHLLDEANPGYWKTTTFPYSAPRFGAVWRVDPDVAVRAAVGGGYALPALYNLTGSALSFNGNSYCESIANPNIKPEETFGYDIGTDVRMRRYTVLSFDLYRTNLYGQFYSSYTESTYNGLPLYANAFGNLGTSRMEGINLDIHRDAPSGYYWRGTLGLTRGYVVSVPPGFYNGNTGYPPVSCTNCENGSIIPGQNFNSAASYLLSTVPYASASAEIGYRWNPGKYVDLLSTYYGNNNIYYEPAFVELDAHAGYAITRNVSLLATFRNITGIYDQSIQTRSPSYVVPVVPGTPANVYGAAYGLPYGPRSVIVTVNVK